MSELSIRYRPVGAEENIRVSAVYWADAPGVGARWVIPTGGGERRYVRVRKIKGVWVEVYD